MRQCLPIKSQSLPSLHGIINIEVLHAKNVFIYVELAQIPIFKQKLVTTTMIHNQSAYQIMAPRALIALLDEAISLIDFGIE